MQSIPASFQKISGSSKTELPLPLFLYVLRNSLRSGAENNVNN
jgi:hypothetical protein